MVRALPTKPDYLEFDPRNLSERKLSSDLHEKVFPHPSYFPGVLSLCVCLSLSLPPSLVILKVLGFLSIMFSLASVFIHLLEPQRTNSLGY